MTILCCLQVYVLLIKNLTVKDAGLYICELNSVNVTRSFHELKVLTDRLLAPVVASDDNEAPGESSDSGEAASTATKDSIDVWNYSTERPINHDYSDCCSAKNVSKSCLGFCNIKNILEGTTGDLMDLQALYNVGVCRDQSHRVRDGLPSDRELYG